MQIEEAGQHRTWWRYTLMGLGILLSILLAVAAVYYWEELQNAAGYGYAGAFFISIFGGITIIPVPSLLVVFSLGHALNPVYVALLSGLGEALGGITVYLTGAGGGVIWSKFWARRQVVYPQPDSDQGKPTPAESRAWARGQALYDRLSARVGRRGISWLVFIVSAFVWGLYYFVGLAAGSLNMGLKRFFLVSLAGKVVRGLIVAYAGHYGLSALLQWIGG